MNAKEILHKQQDEFDNKVAIWERTLQDLSGIWEALQFIDGVEPDFDARDGCINLRFAGDSELLRKVWKILRAGGYHPDSRLPAEPKASFCTFWRIEKLDSEGESHEDRRYARIWMHFSSTICKIVQVGTKTVEQPVYEVQCASALAELGV